MRPFRSRGIATALLVPFLALSAATTVVAAEGGELASDDVPLAVARIERSGLTETIHYKNGSTFTSTTADFGILGGGFSWTAYFDESIESRVWEQVYAGTVRLTVGVVSNCASGTIVARVRNRFFPHTSYGTRDIPCSGTTATWTGVPAGQYRFTLQDTITWDGNEDHYTAGYLTYP